MNKHSKWIKILLIGILMISFFVPQSNTAFAKKKELGGEKNGCLALNYHRVRDNTFVDKILKTFSSSKEMTIYSVTNSQLENHIKWLKAHHANFVTLDELLKYKEKGKYPKNCVWVNFDDMDESIYENAFPILKKHNVPATGFVITNKVGTNDFHNLNISSKQQLKEMKDSGLWDFASHTDNMHNVKKNTSTLIHSAKHGDISSDMNKSTDYIDKELNGNTEAFAYPYGQADENVAKQLKAKTSIKYAFTLEEKAMQPDDDPYFIPRIMVSDDAFNTLVKHWKGFK
nr:intercellular adhesin biosynthesis polysaccharide N-deacetylase [Mammaliicoccus sp. Marseille-Q6498]